MIVEIDTSDLKEPITDAIHDALVEALIAGAWPIIRAAEANLNDHRSEQTGTGGQESARGSLADSMTFQLVRDEEGELELLIGPDDLNDDIGAFLEYGYDHAGNERKRVEGQHWFEDAFDESASQSIFAIENSFSQSLRS